MVAAWRYNPWEDIKDFSVASLNGKQPGKMCISLMLEWVEKHCQWTTKKR